MVVVLLVPLETNSKSGSKNNEYPLSPVLEELLTRVFNRSEA